ncbi:MAG: M14 family zinc carboxypeptidase [Gemmatimonadaceae bacterium]
MERIKTDRFSGAKSYVVTVRGIFSLTHLFVNRFLLASLYLLAIPNALRAQHGLTSGGGYDAGVPTPGAVLGYEIGDRFTPHSLLMRYMERVTAASGRVRLDTMSRTFEGRESVLAIVTSEANHARMAQILADAAHIADPRGVAPSELSAAVSRMPVIVWLAHTVHGGEASGTEAAIALLYQLAAGSDADTRTILDSAVVLIDPVQNPDGHERHAQDVARMRPAWGIPTAPSAMIHQGSWPGPRTSHYYFDLNRDWFILSHPETRGRVAAFRKWYPHVAADLHEMGSNSTYFFAPPMEPVNKNVHSSILKWWDIFGEANAKEFDLRGWSFFRREGYDEFYPGYGVSWPILTGAVGMTYEQASSAGGAIRRVDGTILTLREAASHHYAAAWATALTSARRVRERVRDYLVFRQSAISEGSRGPMRTVVIQRDAQGRADTLAARLAENGIEVGQLDQAITARAAMEYGSTRSRDTRIPSGAWVIDLAQPQGRLAKALLEPDAELDSAFIRTELESRRTAQPERFYDLTAWSLPLTYRVRAWWTGVPIAAKRASFAHGDPRPIQSRQDTAPLQSLPTPRYGYAFEAGSEASLGLLAGLLADSIRVWYAPRAFRSGTHDFPHGAFVARVAANDSVRVHERVRAHVAWSGARVAGISSAAVDAGTDLGSNSVFPIRIPRVAMLGGAPVSGNSFGFAWYAFDQRLGYPVTSVDANAVTGGALEDFTVLVVPSVSVAGLERVLGDTGRERIATWVRGGGVLVTLNGATAWLASEKLGLARLRLRRDTVRADSTGGAPLPAEVPGAIVRATTDTLSPLLAGVYDTELPVLVYSDRIYTAPKDLRAGEAVVRYASKSKLRLSGYLWPEVPERLAETPYLWTERVGRGRVIGFAGDPNFRDLWRGLLPLFANAVLLGGSF